MEQELRKIKKLYGEAMSRFCRDNFSTILEEEGRLLEILTDKFEPNHDLYTDILAEEMENSFKEYIYSLVNVQLKDEIEIEKSPEELLSEAGYDLYECITEEEIQGFKKYYAPGEELCTFHGKRLESCRVYFAVKKDVDKINREDFKNPMRQDIYGTSVISIQFSKNGANTLSIKNRYNHTVKNPDATFGNNLDNIISGLTKSFEKYYSIVQENVNDDFELEGYGCDINGKYYKYNYEIYNVYYCPNNVIIDGYEAKYYEKEKYLIIDDFILDLVNKTINMYDDRITDGFIDTIKNIKKIEIKKENENKKIILTLENDNVAIIEINSNNQIIGYTNNFIDEIGDAFLTDNETLKKIELLNVRKVGYNFLNANNVDVLLNMPNIEEVGSNFLENNRKIKDIKFLKLKKVGNWFFYQHTGEKRINLPALKEVGMGFLASDIYIEEITLPDLISCDSMFIPLNQKIKQITLPKLEEVGTDFLSGNIRLQKASFPSLKKITSNFLLHNEFLIEIDLPELIEVGADFCLENRILAKINCPKLKKIGCNFLLYNEKILKLDLPNV